MQITSWVLSSHDACPQVTSHSQAACNSSRDAVVMGPAVVIAEMPTGFEP